MNELLENEKKLSKELGQLKTENQWLVNNQKGKKSVDAKDESQKQFEMYKKELKDEKEKVENLAVWKSQLSDKNKELKEENKRYIETGDGDKIVPLYYWSFSRLLNKVEDLERLMNDEVTDINEILNVIDTIQVTLSNTKFSNQFESLVSG